MGTQPGEVLHRVTIDPDWLNLLTSRIGTASTQRGSVNSIMAMYLPRQSDDSFHRFIHGGGGETHETHSGRILRD